MFDPHTLIAVVVVLGVILGLCLLGLRQTLPPSIGGLYPWAFALFAFAGAALVAFLVSQQTLDGGLLLYAGFAYVGAWVFLVVALRRFTGRPTPWQGVLAALVLVALPGLPIAALDSASGWSPFWLLGVMLLCTAAGLETLLRSAPARQSLGGRLLLFSLVMQLSSGVLRIGFSVAGDLPPGWLQNQTATHAQFGLVFACAALLVATIGLMLMATDRLRRMLEHLATHDALTGLLERSGFRVPAEHSLALAQRRGEPVACLLGDIDHFKQVNDRYGHPAGDAVLVQIATLLRDSARASDLVARFGGEEFALLLPNCDDSDAARFAERLRQAVEARPLSHGGQTIAVTLSIGIAVGRGDALQLEALYQRADRALYAAKRGGRNRVRSAPTRPSNVAQKPTMATDSSD